jgi:hypothetical protein
VTRVTPSTNGNGALNDDETENADRFTGKRDENVVGSVSNPVGAVRRK